MQIILTDKILQDAYLCKKSGRLENRGSCLETVWPDASVLQAELYAYPEKYFAAQK